MIPTPLHQYPQLVCELWVGWSRGALTGHYGQCRCCWWVIAEGDRDGEYLRRYGVAVSKSSAGVTHSHHTSIMTIPKEKTSASLLYVPSSVKISGAVHRAVWPWSSEVVRIESRF